MAIRFTYSYRFILTRAAEGTLQGIGAVAPDFGAEVQGFWGQFPTVRVDDRRLCVDANPDERPRWWSRGEARLRAAVYQRSHLAMGPDFAARLVRPEDELRLSLDANARMTLAIHRENQLVFVVGPASCDLDDPDSTTTVLRHLAHVDEPRLPPGAPTPSWPQGDARLVDRGPWRLAMLQEKARGPWGLVATWCAYPVALGIPDPTLLGIAQQFLAPHFHHEPW